MEKKFRFWLGHTKKMTYPHNISEVPKIIPEFTPDIISLQFSGLCDINGREIYEGDIISGWRKGSNSSLGYTGVIEWRTEQAGWVVKCGKYILEILSLAMEGDSNQTRLSSFHLIGNIYENPELLTPQPTHYFTGFIGNLPGKEGDNGK